MKTKYNVIMFRPTSLNSKTLLHFKKFCIFCKKFSATKTHYGSSENIPDSAISGDLVGQPHPISNLRPFRHHIPKNESSIEKKLRLEREAVQAWNQEFWISHNNKFLEV
uniref:APOPT family protein CG14806, mitochondrial n=1 Tax=Clastoptera arizonana TaxID=38151 RepID=A0A1B6EGZ2_9HEMI